MSRALRPARAVTALVLLACPAALHALASTQSACDPLSARAAGTAAGEGVGRARAWPVPLDRLVSLDAGETTLGAALERIATDARIRLSYSPELVPLDRRVCKRALRTGSRAAFERTCMTVREWATQSDDQKKVWADEQAGKGFTNGR